MQQHNGKVRKWTVFAPVFLVAGLLFAQCTFTHHAKKSYRRAQKEKPFDVVVVPGLPYDGEQTSSVMKLRLFWAKHLYDSGVTRNIIFSGSAVYTPFIEAVAMKTMADSLGIPSQHTFAETKAEHSTENVYYSWKMAKRLGFKKVALATDPFQAAMLRSFMRRFCPGMKTVPYVAGKINLDSVALPRIDTTAAYVKNFVSIREREGFWKRFRGTMGKRVKEERKAEARRAEVETVSN
jgi:vancomycin permeability regulator SanA